MPLNPRIKFILEIALLLGTAAAMAIIISFGLTVYLGGSSHPTVAVTTGSMLPIYNGFQDGTNDPIYPFRGDILLVRKVPVESIEVGDVIVFETTGPPDEPVVHRVIDKWLENGNYNFKTNGDNRDDPDPWIISGEDVYGVVVIRIPHIGWFLLVVQTTVGKIIILALAILLLFVGNDSEEKKDKSIVEKTEEQKVSDSTRINFVKKTIKSRKGIYSVLIFLILLTFIASNLIGSLISPPSVNLYSYNTHSEEKIDNLLESTNVNPYTISKLYEPWSRGTNSTQTVHFFPVQIEICSGGLFNNIEKIEIITHVNGTEAIYRWNMVYNFIGTRVFKGAIIATLNGSGNYSATVSLGIYTRGLLASPDRSITFPLILQS
ncbi:MAG: signal peptidase I [Candidatus Hodarchaeota archaeon]